MIRITHVITNLSTGGAEMMLLKLARASSGEFQHSVISLQGSGSIGPRLQQLGVEVEALHFGSFRSLFGYFRLLRVLAKQKPDVIQSWMYHANLAATIVGLQLHCNRKLSWSIRCSLDDVPSRKLLTRIIIRLGVWLSSLPDIIVYNSERSQFQHEMLGYRQSKSRCISNGFDFGDFCPSKGRRADFREKLGISEDKIVIGTVGRASPLKDHATFIRAAASIAYNNPQVVFLIAGRNVPVEFAQNEELGALIAGMGGQLILLDEQLDVPSVMNAMDIFVLCSVAEGFPNVLGEAMACELPCVVTDVGDCRLIVGDTGRIVSPKNVHLLAAEIQDLLLLGRDKWIELGARSGDRVRSKFSVADSVLKYESEWKRINKQN